MWRWGKIELEDYPRIIKAVEDWNHKEAILIHNKYELSGRRICCEGNYILIELKAKMLTGYFEI